MYTNTTGSSANYFTYAYPQPNICPGCGRCRDCGQPAPVVSPLIWGDPYPSITWNGPITNGTTWIDSGNDITLTTEADANERDE